jgi:hypothetical protein
MFSNLQSEFRSQLLADEQLVWTGRPGDGFYFQSSDIFQTIFGVFWLGFALFWTYNAGQASGTFALFGIPFILIGIYQLFGRFLWDAYVRKHTIYGLTSERLLIRSGYFTRSFRSVPLRSLKQVQYTPHNDGSGTLSLGPDQSSADKHFHWSGEWKEGPATQQLVLLRVENARQLHQHILQSQLKEPEEMHS